MSSRSPATAPCRCSSGSRAATPPTIARTARPGTSSAGSPAAPTSSTSPTASSPPPRTWRISTARAVGSSASCRAPATRTRPSAPRSERGRWPGERSTTRSTIKASSSIGSRSVRSAEQTAEGYRLVWYHSTRKAELDAASRLKRIERALSRLDALRQKLASPRTRYRERCQGLRGRGGGPAGVRRRRLGHRRGVGADRRDVPPGATGPAGCDDAVRPTRDDSVRADASDRVRSGWTRRRGAMGSSRW